MNTRCSVPVIEAEALVLALSLLDIEEVEGSRKGKLREDACLTDEEIAFNIQAENLKISLAELQDRRFALSLDEALQTDTAALRALSLINQGERDDHLAALALERGDNSPTPTHSQEALEWTRIPPVCGSTMFGNNDITDIVEPDPDEMDDLGESSHLPYNVGKLSARGETLSRVECIICGDPIRRSQRFDAPCSHFYCRDCLVNLAEASTRDETLYPLRCCRQPLPVANVLPLLPLDLRSQFQDKSAEFATPPTSRVYCPNQTCSTFLGSSSGGRFEITCTTCTTRVCSACKNRAHSTEDCAENAQSLMIQSLASQMGWQTCPGCHAIVELWQGCYHMTCRCSTQFCYLCAALWKNCDCRQWDDQRLLDDAERRVYNQFGAREAAAHPAIFVDRVYQRMAELEEDHECLVHEWEYRSGGGRCEECHDDLWRYLMRCIHCQALTCRRCSVNRL
ncbi:hypothetical protein DEU56DRAFT_438705 [Suillus clintonianus]|uniref:uncharacterized protein n=1 Tax=Suillus clintonianus TaxID=1904413 RepID=UPI001B85DA00|nr:uncharacterized protein DEU56DRAFT_438705 [Suillus clintonianus]KAG2154107.1 hypothetical protein DEU56DRAFT_438705 [Suillus clintonianus]